MPCRWIMRSDEDVPSSVAAFADELNVSSLIAEILWSRGLQSRSDMDRFLSPMLRHLADPVTIPGLERAADVLAEGLRQGRKLAVWGDYDVDGITSTAVVKDFLRQCGVEALHHLPNRLREGYGMNVQGVEALAEEGVELLLTVDCGISDLEPIARAKELGMTVVVTDHHLPPETLPPADAICDPRLDESCHECADLAGVGVAFMLVVRLRRLMGWEHVDVRDLLDLVALGTIADVVSLTGQNRILVKNGLLKIKDAGRPGMAALKLASDYDQFAELGAGQIGFNLAPRINAAGRLGDPEKALKLLLAGSVDEAMPYAQELDMANTERRRQEAEIAEEAMHQAELQAHRVGLVLYAEHWHPGIIGIVASRVSEKFYKPTLILCKGEDGVVKGSGRSISEFHLHDGLKELSDMLLGFGGHKQAAGLSLDAGNLDELKRRFNEVVAAELGDIPLRPSIKVDRVLPFREIDYTLLRELELLQPFGLGNPEPVFISPPVTVQECSAFGREREHVKLTLADAETNAMLPGKAWRMASELTPDNKGRVMRFAFSPKIDRFSGVPRIELRVRDWNE
ncbi:single-stranded-DNA-specific exonuclease RecJ [Salidesulfovibrio onnuriiensis]|uniref:single-stranded-DNA-specific exonuclease RecJ n=1 Tax=Salidesulfovibrio onnuriiensis TaxID=2583823 RepID=UPI0011CA3E85|nr:single-stranded-DNA-specific exonuclease RecJ [Salidesulfovibrio onnuriiensis]